MFLNFMKKEEDGRDTVDLTSELDRSDRKRAFLLLAVRALLQCTREFVLDVKELDTQAFKAGLAELAERLAAEEKLSRVEALFESRKSGISSFAQRQKDYLRERETEFKDIIDILSKAMVAMDSENRDYNHSILEQSTRIEAITHLDDIKRIKQTLLQEVENMREAVRDKESRDVAKIESLSKQVAVLNTELESARTESERDGLTGVLNRRTFDRFLGELVEKNTVKEQNFALLLIDIDDFKRINDSYGHPVGDSVLTAVANKCRQSIRGEDFLARYGGEEFAIILPGASLRNAVKKGRHICQTIAATRYLLEGVDSGDPLGLTVSIGVSVCGKADTAAAMVNRADKALYAAKGSGKNRTCSEKDVR
ncbi:MAG: diguanylate cyclase [Deltaproteobacteria bacterium]|nr:diguanylate cyclase [Deltaproteobacteria bacterium]